MKRLLFFYILFAFIVTTANAQKFPTDTNNIKSISNIIAPEFKGGTKALQFYLSQNMNYPPAAKNKGIEGVVLVNFIIDSNGNVIDVESSSTADPLLVKEAIRLVKLLPRWKPASAEGRPVKIKSSIPVSFKIR